MLTVDLGNSRAKLRLWSSGAGKAVVHAPVARLDLEGEALEELEGWLREHRPSRAALSSVASAVRTARVRERLERVVGELVVAPPSGLENRCVTPDSVGSDRLYAALGAAAALGRSCLVVDAGTALTVDALLVSGGARAFLGGAIAPGPTLLAEALAAGTARLPRIEPHTGARALGRSTADALQGGVVVGFRGAARELVEELAREAGFSDAPVVLTGGARRFLLEPQPFTARELRVDEELVHRGLLVAALGSSAAAAT